MTSAWTIDGAATALVDVLSQHIGKPVFAVGGSHTAAVLAALAELGEPPPRCYTVSFNGHSWFLRRVQEMTSAVGAPLGIRDVPDARVPDDVVEVVRTVRVAFPPVVQLGHMLLEVVRTVAVEEHESLVCPWGSRHLTRIAESYGIELALPWNEGGLAESGVDPAVVAETLGAPPYVACPEAASGLREAHQHLLASPLNQTHETSLRAFYGTLVGREN